jgi:hypothetical protein
MTGIPHDDDGYFQDDRNFDDEGYFEDDGRVDSDWHLITHASLPDWP